MKTVFTKVKHRIVKTKIGVASVGVGVLAMSSQTFAALPAWATSLGGDLTAAVEDVATAVGPVVVGALVAFITIKLIKRGANKI